MYMYICTSVVYYNVHTPNLPTNMIPAKIA